MCKFQVCFPLLRIKAYPFTLHSKWEPVLKLSQMFWEYCWNCLGKPVLMWQKSLLSVYHIHHRWETCAFFSATTIWFTLNTHSATKKEPLLEVDPVIADRILFEVDPGKIEAERPRLAPSPPGPSSAKKPFIIHMQEMNLAFLKILQWISF